MTQTLTFVQACGKTANSHSHAPSYLYRKRNIYSFRYVIPQNMRESLGGTEDTAQPAHRLYAERHTAFLINNGFFSKEEIEESKAVTGRAGPTARENEGSLTKTIPSYFGCKTVPPLGDQL
jgi:hypothetical protein